MARGRWVAGVVTEAAARLTRPSRLSAPMAPTAAIPIAMTINLVPRIGTVFRYY